MLLAVDLLVIDDFGLDAHGPHTESRDAYDILTERHRAGSIIVTFQPRRMALHLRRSRPSPERYDRFTSTAYDLVIEGESYRCA